jgi:hypothetical protein
MSGEKKRKKLAPGGGECLFDLPFPLQCLILARIPIAELRRLMRAKVSPQLTVVIRAVLKQIALNAVKKSLDLDEQGAEGEDDYYQVSKVQYIVSR